MGVNEVLQFEKLQCTTKENTINKKMNKIRGTKYRKWSCNITGIIQVGPKVSQKFENYDDNTELRRYAKRYQSFESCGGYHFKNVCKFSHILTTNVHTPARTTPYTQIHNPIVYARRITTQLTVSKSHSSQTRAKITQTLSLQGEEPTNCTTETSTILPYRISYVFH